MKKILITGITGFVGSHLCEFLLHIEEKNIIYGFKRPNSRLRNVKDFRNKINWLDGDLVDYFSVRKAIERSTPDEIYHLGALSWVTPSWDMPAAYMEVNAIGTINLLEAIRETKLNARMLISCTPEEYGDVPESLLPITEKTRIAPVNPYAASKVAQDVICQVYYASYNIPIIRTRAFNHEGSRRDIHGAIASFAYQIALIERNKQSPVLKVGNLEAKRNFTHVKDMVEAYYLAMKKGIPGELYLIGSNELYTMEEILLKLIEKSRYKGKIKWEVDPNRVRLTENRLFVGNFDKFYKLTRWKPRINLDQLLDDTLNYWREFIDTDMY